MCRDCDIKSPCPFPPLAPPAPAPAPAPAPPPPTPPPPSPSSSLLLLLLLLLTEFVRQLHIAPQRLYEFDLRHLSDLRVPAVVSLHVGSCTNDVSPVSKRHAQLPLRLQSSITLSHIVPVPINHLSPDYAHWYRFKTSVQCQRFVVYGSWGQDSRGWDLGYRVEGLGAALRCLASIAFTVCNLWSRMQRAGVGRV